MRFLRSVGKTCYASVYNVTRTVGRRGAPSGAPFIICYHRVVEDFEESAKTAIPSMLVSARMLERHIDWLARRFSIVSLDDVGRHLESGHSARKPIAAITFDDGYADVFHHGFPLLKRKGIPAAVFVVTDLAGTGRPQIFDRLYLSLRLAGSRGLPLRETVNAAIRAAGVEGAGVSAAPAAGDEAFRVMTVLLNRFPGESVERIMAELSGGSAMEKALEESGPLTWEMIETMHKSGITIGSHTKSHTLLTSESLAEAASQLTGSKQTIESRLRAPVRHFAYPDGRFNPLVVQAVRSAGYQFAYGICRQRDPGFPLLTISRKVLWERASLNLWGGFSSSIMNCHAHGAFDPEDRCEHDHSSSEPGEN
ncbi:MAG TPA: polysaccharide deacetylase family protein [Terriglobia bacterium]|jgi:peptidoglycan/xylan/chitin deacetylase (PgdA/CDA1 family)